MIWRLFARKHVTSLVYWEAQVIPHRLPRVECFERFRQQQNSAGIEMSFRD